jgi:hypothetical protein
MAEITNGQTGNQQIGIQINFLRKEVGQGIIERGCVSMNSDMGLLWTEVSFFVAEEPFYAQEVLLHSSDVRSFTRSVQQIIEFRDEYDIPRLNSKTNQYGIDRTVQFDITSPELLIRLDQHVYIEQKKCKNFQDFIENTMDQEAVERSLRQLVTDHASSSASEQKRHQIIRSSRSYEMQVIIDIGIARGASGSSDEGPAMVLLPEEGALLRFIRDMRSEAELVLLMD